MRAEVKRCGTLLLTYDLHVAIPSGSQVKMGSEYKWNSQTTSGGGLTPFMMGRQPCVNATHTVWSHS